MKRLAILLLFATAMMLHVHSAAAATGGAFEDANRAFAAGDFQKAIEGYDQIVRSGSWSANLFYDLGNAWFRAGDTGKAMLNYERALALDPHHPEAQANLRLVRDHARALELRPTPVERYVAFATENQFAVAAAIAFWIAAFVAVRATFAPRRSLKRASVLTCSVAVGAAAAFAAYVLEQGFHGRALAVVTAKNIEARVATADSASSVLALPPGSEVKIISARGDWLYVALPNDQHGWIASRAAESVRL